MFARFQVPVQPAWAFVLPDGEVQTLLGAVDDETLDGLIENALA